MLLQRLSLPQTEPLHLCSAPGAACYAGVNYFRALVAALASEFPAAAFTFTLDCGDDAAVAQEAYRLGFTQVRCASPLDPLANAANADASNA